MLGNYSNAAKAMIAFRFGPGVGYKSQAIARKSLLGLKERSHSVDRGSDYAGYVSPFRGDYMVKKNRVLWSPPHSPMEQLYGNKGLENVTVPAVGGKGEQCADCGEKGSIRGFASASRAGKMANGAAKQNQDSLIVSPDLTGTGKDIHLFGVADGHGTYGKQVSLVVSYAVPKHLRSLLLKHPDSSSEVIRRTFSATTEELSRSKIDTSLRFANLAYLSLVDQHVPAP